MATVIAEVGKMVRLRDHGGEEKRSLVQDDDGWISYLVLEVGIETDMLISERMVINPFDGRE